MGSKNFPQINVSVIGKTEDGCNFLTHAISESVKKYGEVISGDYLEKKSLPKRKELFHIKYYTSKYECEHINAPFTPDNISIASLQSDVMVLVININEGINNQHQAVLRLLKENKKSQVILFFNIPKDSFIDFDSDLAELAEIEGEEILESLSLVQKGVHIILGCLEKEPDEIADRVIDIIDTHFSPNEYSLLEEPQFYIEKVYQVSSKGLKHAPVAFGFLAGGTIFQGMDLDIIGIPENIPNVRVRSIEIFGKNVQRCEAGRSAAILLEKTPKNFPKPGHILLTDSKGKKVARELSLILWMATEELIDPVALVSSYQQFSVFYNMGRIEARLIEAHKIPSEDKLLMRVLLEKPIMIFSSRNVLLGVGEDVLAVGTIAEEIVN